MSVIQHDAVLSWNEPRSVALRGTLVVLPGRGESPPVYERFGQRLAADAYRVHVVTAPTDSAVRVLEQVSALLGETDEALPRVVVGSDAGAAYAAYLAAHDQLGGASALILAGLPTASTGSRPTGWDEELDLRTSCSTHRARISRSGVHPGQLFTDLPIEWLDPTTPGRIALPTLGMHGRDDVVSPLASARRWYAGVPQAELVAIAGGRHDVLNDQTHRTVAATIVLFLERLRGGPARDAIAGTELVTTANRS
jgi:alpha-beta hydrolase superfamily lysophospholipase